MSEIIWIPLPQLKLVGLFIQRPVFFVLIKDYSSLLISSLVTSSLYVSGMNYEECMPNDVAKYLSLLSNSLTV